MTQTTTQNSLQNSVALNAFYALFTSPKCNVCGQILEGSVTFAVDKYWCHNHFTCARCNVGLRNEDYIAFCGRAYCYPCYTNHSPCCRACGKVLVHGQKFCALGRFHYWHEGCFRCKVCKQLAGQENYIWMNDTLYCLKCDPKPIQTM